MSYMPRLQSLKDLPNIEAGGIRTIEAGAIRTAEVWKQLCPTGILEVDGEGYIWSENWFVEVEDQLPLEEPMVDEVNDQREYSHLQLMKEIVVILEEIKNILKRNTPRKGHQSNY